MEPFIGPIPPASFEALRQARAAAGAGSQQLQVDWAALANDPAGTNWLVPAGDGADDEDDAQADPIV